MRIDKQYESATVEPIGRQRVALIGALVVSSLVALTSLYDLISTVVTAIPVKAWAKANMVKVPWDRPVKANSP